MHRLMRYSYFVLFFLLLPGLAAELSPAGESDLYRAAKVWDGTIIEEKEMTSGGETPLEAHVVKRDPSKATGLQQVQQLLAQGADVNARDAGGWTPLMAAIEWHNIATAKLLLEHGADPNVHDKSGGTPLVLAVRQNCVEVVRELVGRGVPLSDTLMFEATHYEIIHYLVGQGLHINVMVHGRTPLHASVDATTASTMEWLLVHGADPTIKNERGLTALGMLEAANHSPGEQFVYDDMRKEVLLRVAAGQLDMRGANGRTLLHAAAALGIQSAVETLLAKGVDVNIQDEQGNTPLYDAIRERQVDIIRLLLEKQAHANCKNKQGQTPMQLLFSGEGNRSPGPMDAEYAPLEYSGNRGGDCRFAHRTRRGSAGAKCGSQHHAG